MRIRRRGWRAELPGLDDFAPERPTVISSETAEDVRRRLMRAARAMGGGVPAPARARPRDRIVAGALGALLVFGGLAVLAMAGATLLVLVAILRWAWLTAFR